MSLITPCGGARPEKVAAEPVKGPKTCRHTDADICDCICHHMKGVMHVMACCWKCEACGRMIKYQVWWAEEDERKKKAQEDGTDGTFTVPGASR